MRVTTAQLRQIVANPRRYVAHARASAAAPQYGNPQRAWMEGAWRAYFDADRAPTALWEAFARKVAAGRASRSRAQWAAGAVPLLEQFLAWDADEPQAPVDRFARSGDVRWHGHILALRRDLVYLTATGYLVRQCWTSRELGLDHPDVGLMVAAVLVCADADLGVGRTEAVDIWHLRDGQRRSWERALLVAEAERLRERLDEVAAAVG